MTLEENETIIVHEVQYDLLEIMAKNTFFQKKGNRDSVLLSAYEHARRGEMKFFVQ